MWVRPERVREFELLWEKVVSLTGKQGKQGKEGGGKKKRQD